MTRIVVAHPGQLAGSSQLGDRAALVRMLSAPSRPLDVGRAERSVPPPMRAALIARDRHCAFPGCDRPPSWCIAHHIRHWADGGSTSLDNLVMLCGQHHTAVHHAGWTVGILADTRLPVFRPPQSESRTPRRLPADGVAHDVPVREHGSGEHGWGGHDYDHVHSDRRHARAPAA
jgi:hypothetical protein